MDKKELIQFLRKSLGAIPNLSRLSHHNYEYPLWRDQIGDVLEEVFGRDSTEYKRFTSAWSHISVAGRAQQEYIEELKMRETAILSIIQKYEILGIEEEPTVQTKPKDAAELPSYLFDSMQFHPEIVAVCKSLFETQHYAQAIFEAFKAVESFVKQKTGLSLYGKQLMAQVFSEENPLIKVTEAGKFDKDVQEGFKFLFMGAIVGIRNPKAHQKVIQKDPFITLEYLGFASFLIKRIEGWEVD